jgi:hypothetical protein
MDREKAISELEMCVGNSDYEMAHAAADDVLVDLLTSLGYEDVVAVWDRVGKWYA